MLDWTLDAGRWTLDAGRWTLDAGRWTDAECKIFCEIFKHLSAKNMEILTTFPVLLGIKA
jgi:hypothetical protein